MTRAIKSVDELTPPMSRSELHDLFVRANADYGHPARKHFALAPRSDRGGQFIPNPPGSRGVRNTFDADGRRNGFRHAF